MMKKILFFVCVALFSCGSAPEDDGGYITSSGGEEDLADAAELDDSVVYNLEDQPEIIQSFYALKPEQISTDFCYYEKEVKNLLMGDGVDEYVWISKKIEENYLEFSNDECYTTTEFAILNPESALPYSVLIQSSKGAQNIAIFIWNGEEENWSSFSNYPTPKAVDFYSDLTPEEAKQVKEFGAFFGYYSEQANEIIYTFSTWQMGLNADGKEIMDFNREPDFSFALMHDPEDGFWLKKIYEDETKIPKRYFLAYTETGEISDDFSYFSDMIGEELEDDGVESVFADFTQTNYKAYFKADTFDFSSMQQFEPRNGYWFFERGKEPLDVEYNMVEPTVKQARRYFGEHP